MGLFERLFKKKEAPQAVPEGYRPVQPYVAEPQFYQDQAGNPFGSFALTEETLTLLPKNPHGQYVIGGEAVTDFRLALISTTQDDMVGVLVYDDVLPILVDLAVQETETHLLLPPLSLEELQALVG